MPVTAVLDEHVCSLAFFTWRSPPRMVAVDRYTNGHILLRALP